VVIRLARARSEAALPFLLIRLNDWVPSIRVRARTAVIDFLEPASASLLVRWLPLFDRLARTTRATHGDLLELVGNVLADPASRAGLESGLRSADARVRRRCYPIAAAVAGGTLEALLARGAQDPDVLVRLWAIREGRALPASELRSALMVNAAGDPSAQIRRIAFDHWRAQTGAEAEAIQERFLLDVSAGIRGDAQDDRRARGLPDPAPWYRAHLEGAAAAGLLGALAGVVETGGPEDFDLILRYLDHSRAKVRRLALRGLNRLAPERALPFLLEALLQAVGPVAGEAVRCLSRRLDEIDPAGLWAGAPEGDGLAARRRLLLLYRGLPKWVALEFILRGVASSAPRLQRLALQELAAWNGGFNRRMAPLPAEDRDQLRLLLDAVEHRIAPGMVAQLRFVLRA
jgi:hypothetical protein